MLLPDRANVLRVFDGTLRGNRIKFGQGKRENAYVEQWTDTGDLVSWPVRVAEAAAFEVTASYDAGAQSAGGTYRVSVGSSPIAGVVREGNDVVDTLSVVRLEPGEREVRVAPVKIVGGELMRLRTITLKAVRHGTSSAR